MEWLHIVEIIGAAGTFWFLFLIIKELRKSIKESNNGKQSGKCDLD
ncbi:MAG: hypothetical protein IE885_08795 [Campylobacterales bacterium]|nr:hypothetical protein [Campylobacterales bacterium]